MSTLSIFEPFAKGKQKQSLRTSNAVIYTRVSTKEQADNNLSLEVQLKACRQYAEKLNFSIIASFGNTHESALIRFSNLADYLSLKVLYSPSSLLSPSCSLNPDKPLIYQIASLYSLFYCESSMSE